MDSPTKTNLTNDIKEFNEQTSEKSSSTIVPMENEKMIPTIIIESFPSEDNLTVTPAFPNFPTDEEVVIKPDNVVFCESTYDTSEPSPVTTARPSQQTLQIMDELKYLLKPTNSLANQQDSIQASQETDSAIKRRTVQFDNDFFNSTDRLSFEGLTPQEVKSLDAAQRRLIVSSGRHSSNILPLIERTRARSMLESTYNPVPPQPTTIIIAQPENRTIVDRLSGLFWAFIAAYAFSIILFVTKRCGIDLIFSFFLQMTVQTIAFAVYAIYKNYNLLGPPDHRLATIIRGLLIGIGVLNSFLAYYYITLPDISAIRQSQVVLTIILSIFFLHERITISRIIACILTIIAIIVLIRPTTLSNPSNHRINSTELKTSWISYSSSWNNLIGIGLALCTAITYSIASILNKIYFSTQHLHNTVLCFWSALTAFIISLVLVCLTHFFIDDRQKFPHDWRLFVSIGLALISIFVFIANQKATKRERTSIVTLIYSTDILLALILQNFFTTKFNDPIIILGCLLILIAIVIVCIEVLKMEKTQNTLTIQVNNINEQNNDHLANSSIDEPVRKRISI